ncbi:hypothetical protein NC653_036016 [Populus alba x Populus x berolinensis]|uniref:Uncharacterized protein n=1 Tax=Populus alba x Populus x berolinensis TaxID=444605 RepID=A0AAD6LJ72_9ROSI|nr:hypothetical protein NC653_036016 [Populus alba x Populus x berolinensis]
MSETVNNDASSKHYEWLIEIMKDAEETTHDDNQVKGPAFPRVPSTVREIQQNRDCYDPSVVSIGPYHHGNTKLKETEKLKETYAREFVKDRKKLTPEIVEAVLSIAKNSYLEDARRDFNDEQLAKMMFVDGCFILQFMRCLNAENEDLKMSEQQIFHVKRDLLLLENQLPFEVLHSLGGMRYENASDLNKIINNFISLHIRSSSKPIPKWIWVALTSLGLVMIPIILPLFVIACCCFCLWICSTPFVLRFIGEKLLGKSVSLDWSPPPPSEEKSGTRDDEPQPAHPPPTRKEKSGKRDDERQPAHLLELLYYKSMYHYSESNHKKAAKGSRGHCLYYSAKNLKKVGILFGARWTGAITDVKFKSSIFWGTLKVPPIIIDESTKSLLLNLVAYETSAALDQLWVSSYICFMDSLIDDAKDVKELRSNGIIINYLGADQKVANLFNDMGKSMTHDTAAYNDIKIKINKQCESTVKRWVYEWKVTYFSDPWTIITVLAASFGLALTATQTYYTRYPPGK